jgi:hypothetical protein
VLDEPLVEDLEPGRRLAGRYTVLGPISRGAMGAVYRARGEDGAQVAVKWLIDRRQAARFDIEARLLAALEHPRVVRVLDHFQDESGQYLVMDLVDGTDLARTLRSRGAPGLEVEAALRHAAQACEALQYVHDQQIVHRDVKPQNLIDGPAGTVLVDFGVAREVRAQEAGTRAVGTPQYMAPEVLMGEGISARADVYGLAATLWTLLAGRPPSYQDRTRLAETVPGVSAELEAALRAGLELHPDRRIASAAAFAAALGTPLPTAAGDSLARSVPTPSAPRDVLEAIVRTAAGVFEAAAASIALLDATTGELVYQAAWGAGSREILGVRLGPGTGVARAVLDSGEGIAVADCRADERFAGQIAAGTGYVPHTMVVAPLTGTGGPLGALAVLDRRDGEPYGPADLVKAQLFADLAVTALGVEQG